jgi:hypothetical protein
MRSLPRSTTIAKPSEEAVTVVIAILLVGD